MIFRRLVYCCFICCCLFFCAAFSGCKKSYNPSVINAANNYLVVEGVINNGSDSTIIKLNRTVGVDSTQTKNPELNASVKLESNQNDIITLKDAGAGNYVSASMHLNKSEKYRLRIKTIDNREYLSDFEPVLNTPPIDSVGFNITNEGLLIYANTHDPANIVQYFRWDYTEEWEFHAAFNSLYIVGDTTLKSIRARDASSQIYYCYNGDVSSGIVIASTANLKQAFIYQAPIVSIPKISEKIETEYSILVKQYALTAGAYNFYTQLKKNTENLGSIFDALPSEVSGDFKCISNPKEPVIGYLSINNVPSKRIFVYKRQLPSTWIAQDPFACVPPILTSDPRVIKIYLLNLPHINLLIDTIGGLYRQSPQCADCSIRGNLKPPPYWKN